MDKALEAIFEEAETANAFNFALVGEPLQELTLLETKLYNRVLKLRKFVEVQDKLEKYQAEIRDRSEKLGHELALMQNVSPDSPRANKLRGRLEELKEVHQDLKQFSLGEN